MNTGIKRLSILIALTVLLPFFLDDSIPAETKGFEAENYRVGANADGSD